MNFIEQLFGVAPDGGSGVFEFALLAAVGFLLAISLRRRVAGILARIIRL